VTERLEPNQPLTVYQQRATIFAITCTIYSQALRKEGLVLLDRSALETLAVM